MSCVINNILCSMEQNVEYIEFENVCRTCLISTNIIPIFLSEQLDPNFIAKMIVECTSIKVEENDGLPSNICSSCIEELKRIFSFKSRCESIDKKFRTGIIQRATKNGDSVNNNHCEFRFENDNDKETLLNENDEMSEKLIKKRKNNHCGLQVQPYDCSNPPDEERIVSNHLIKIKKEIIRSKSRTKKPRKRQIKIKRKVCNICKKELNSSHMRIHMRTHTKEKPYNCEFCNKKFSLGYNLRRHIKIHTGEKPHKCNFCDKSFIQAGTLRDHLRVHTGEEGKKQSKRVKYQRRSQENIVPPFTCDLCDRHFSTKFTLQAHRVRHNAEKSFLCSECGKGFINKCGLNSHSTVHSKIKPFTCMVCDKSFARRYDLKKHNLMHTGEKPFSCEICAKKFRQSTHLKIHLRAHQGLKPYSCTICDKLFSDKGNLKIHTRIHTGETPYICSVCKKGFYDSSSLKKHVRGHNIS